MRSATLSRLRAGFPRAAPFLALAAAALAVYWPILAGASYAFRDFMFWTVGSRAVVRDALLKGQLALWNPYLGIGASNLANPQNGVFYPLHGLLALASPVTALNLMGLAHVFIAGAGGYIFGGALGAGKNGATAAGLVTMLCGATSSGWASGIWLLTAAWMPWCAAAAVYLGRGSMRAVAGFGAALALTALAGDPFQTLRALLLGFPLALGAALERCPVTATRRLGVAREGGLATLRFAAGCALGLALASPALIPAAAMVAETERTGGLPLAHSELWSLHPIRLVEHLAPGFFGDATDPERYLGPVDPGAPSALPWALSTHLGVGAVVFVPLALRRRRAPGADGHAPTARVLTLAVATAAALGLLMVLGRHTPVHRIVRAVVFPLTYFRYPEKYLDLLSVAVAGLAALGVERALAAPATAARLSALVAGLLALAAAVLVLLGQPQPMWDALGQGAAFALLLALALLFAHRVPGGSAAALAVVAADLVLAALPLMHWTSARAIETASEVADRSGPPPRVYHEVAQDDVASAPLTSAQKAVNAARLHADNLGALFRVGTLPGYEGTLPASFHRLWDAVSVDGGRALRLLSVERAVMREGLAHPDLAPIGRRHPATVYRVVAPLPRAYLVGRATVVAEAEAYARLLDADVIEGRVALVTRSDHGLDGPAGRAGACAFESYHPERVVLACRAAREALLVVVEAYAPGWRVEVNGREAPVFPANLALRGVRLSAGDHRVSFTYRPPLLGTAFGLGGLGVVAALVLALWPRRRPPGSAVCPPV